MKPASTGPLDTPPPTALAAARLAVHFAAQVFYAAGEALAEKAVDQSHTNLLWHPERRGFVGRPLAGGRRVFLDPATLEVGLIDGDEAEDARWTAVGLTLDGCLARLREALAKTGAPLPAGPLPRPTYDLPDHPLRATARFEDVDPAGRAALARWFALAAAALSDVAAAHDGASEVRCWPHHFDIATLIGIDDDAHEEHARSVGVGLSPGDGGIGQPYVYINPWPAPADRTALPALTAGASWHVDGWFGAVVYAEQIAEADDPAAFVAGALDEAIAAAMKLAGT